MGRPAWGWSGRDPFTIFAASPATAETSPARLTAGQGVRSAALDCVRSALPRQPRTRSLLSVWSNDRSSSRQSKLEGNSAMTLGAMINSTTLAPQNLMTSAQVADGAFLPRRLGLNDARFEV